MGEAVDLSTWRGRVKAARIDAGYGGPTLSALMGRNKNWARDIETGHGSPDPETLAELSRALGRSVQWIVTGEESGRTEFVDALAGMEPELDASGRRTVIAAARVQVEESKARAAAATSTLSEEEAELIRLVRNAQGPRRSEALSATRALLQAAAPPESRSETAAEVDPPAQERSQGTPA